MSRLPHPFSSGASIPPIPLCCFHQVFPETPSCQTPWSLSDRHFLSGLPALSVSWPSSQPASPLTIQTSNAPGLFSLLSAQSLAALSRHVALNPSQVPRPLSPSSLLSTSCACPEACRSYCSSNRPVQNRTLYFYPQNYISLGLDSCFTPRTQAISKPCQFSRQTHRAPAGSPERPLGRQHRPGS